jgi:hypothetical protein
MQDAEWPSKAGPDQWLKLPAQTRVSPDEYKEFLALGHGDIYLLDLDRCAQPGGAGAPGQLHSIGVERGQVQRWGWCSWSSRAALGSVLWGAGGGLGAFAQPLWWGHTSRLNGSCAAVAPGRQLWGVTAAG